MNIDPSLIDVVLKTPSGYSAEAKAGDTREAMMAAAGDAARDFPAELYIDPKDYAAKAAENTANKTWPINYIDRFTNQAPTHECTCHSLRTGFEAARNRQRGVIYGGPEKGKRLEDSAKFGSVWVSPLSIYAEANPRQWGGANCRQVMEIACRRGFLPETIQPRDYGFKHAIHGTTGGGGINQAKGPWVPVSRFPEGWQETAKHFRILEVIFPETVDQIICCVLHGLVVNVGRSGHAVPYSFYDPAQKVMGYIDSYDIVRYDSMGAMRSAASGASAISVVTAPDDWSKPA